MTDYIRVLGECFPDSQAYIVGEDDPSVYENLIWITTPISQAELDASPCADVGSPAEPPPETPTFSGSLITLTFQYESSKVKNRWLAHEGNNSCSSNSTPAILPWNCELIGMTFSNRSSESDTDLRLYAADVDSGNSDTMRIEWNIRNARTAYTTDVTGITFTAGDKLGIYLKDAGSDPSYPVVKIYLQINNETTGTNIESFEGHF